MLGIIFFHVFITGFPCQPRFKTFENYFRIGKKAFIKVFTIMLEPTECPVEADSKLIETDEMVTIGSRRAFIVLLIDCGLAVKSLKKRYRKFMNFVGP